MKKIGYVLFIAYLISAHSGHAQFKKYFSIGVGVNQSTFLLNPGFFSEGELTRMWTPKFYPSPELVGQFNIDLDKKNTVAVAANIIYYQRTITLALPVTIRYDFRFTERKNSPFLRLDAGYSFFLTNGACYGFGLGQQLGDFKASLVYTNQFQNKSILEDNQFIAARIASMSLKFEYAFRK
ncbi:MAG: hypothetical protein AAGA66_11790 [Bacteroidota bacterium]